MSVDLKFSFGKFLRLSLLEYKASLGESGWNAKIMEEAIEDAHTKWHAARTVKRKKPQTDDEWINGLKADPALAGVDVDKEIAKCRFWCRNQPTPLQATRSRIVNWLNKADRTVVVVPRAAAPVAEREPSGWVEWMRQNCPTWQRFAEGATVPSWNGLRSDERAMIVRNMQEQP